MLITNFYWLTIFFFKILNDKSKYSYCCFYLVNVIDEITCQILTELVFWGSFSTFVSMSCFA